MDTRGIVATQRHEIGGLGRNRAWPEALHGGSARPSACGCGRRREGSHRRRAGFMRFIECQRGEDVDSGQAAERPSRVAEFADAEVAGPNRTEACGALSALLTPESGDDR
jgi:hypothetical protein